MRPSANYLHLNGYSFSFVLLNTNGNPGEKKEFRSDCNSVVCAGVFPWENQGTWTRVEVNDAIFPYPHAEYRKTCAQGLRFNKGNNYLASSKSQWSEIALFSHWKNTGTTSILWYTALIHAMAAAFPPTFSFTLFSANVNTLGKENNYFSVIMNIVLTL